MKLNRLVLHGFMTAFLMASVSAHASLTVLQTFGGTIGVSTDGWGSKSQVGVISASVPVGSTVLAAYLYTSTFSREWESLASSGSPVGGTFAGNAVSYTPLGYNNDYLMAGRMDVTDWVKPQIDNGLGGIYNFAVTETSFVQDGEALVVVYNNPLLANATVGILDGFSHSLGDTTILNFAAPLDPSAAEFKAELRLGIGYSALFQSSSVRVNGLPLTLNAGSNDDCDGDADCTWADGRLITVGGFDDPFSPLNPDYYNDHERYDLRSFIKAGDGSITLDTLNPTYDDNIFLAVVDVSGFAGINEPPPTIIVPPVSSVPEPESLVMLCVALAFMAGQRHYSQRRQNPIE